MGKCNFSDKDIYPGHGMQQVKKDGKSLYFIDSKSQSLFNQGKKAAKILWTRTWRITNKKIKVVRDQKKVKKKAKKVQRAIQGIDLAQISAKKTEEYKAQIRSTRQRKLQAAKQKKMANKKKAAGGKGKKGKGRGKK